MRSICPNCDEIVNIPSPADKNTRFNCEYCGEPLRIIRMNPIELDYDFEDFDDLEEEIDEYEDEDYND